MPDQDKQLRLAIEHVIAELFESDTPTSGEVSDVVIESNRDLIQSLSHELARRYVRRLVGSMMKHAAKEPDTHVQFSLFSGLKGLPGALSFEHMGEIRYIKRSRAQRDHYRQHLELLRSSIDADTRREEIIATANEMLEPLRAEFGDLPEAELMGMCARNAA